MPALNLAPLESLHPNRELSTREVASYLGYRKEKTFLNAMYAGQWERPDKEDPHDRTHRNIWLASTVLTMSRRGKLAPGTTKPREGGASEIKKEDVKIKKEDVNWIIAGKPSDYESG